MLPGFLHFDIRSGLRADVLNAAMADLVRDVGPVQAVFDALGLTEISFKVGEAKIFGVTGRVVHFYVGNHLVTLEPAALSTLSLHKPKWNQPTIVPAIDEKPYSPLNNALVQECMQGDSIALLRIRTLFLQAKLKPTISAIAIKILDHLTSNAIPEHTLKGPEALWLVCQLVMLLAQVDILDPKFISVSKLLIGRVPHTSPSPALSLHDPRWLNQVLMDMPVIEQEGAVWADVLALAFLKTLAGHYGVRSQGTIIQVGIGHGSAGTIEALWCEAVLPESIKEYGRGNKARILPLHEIRGLVKTSMDMAHLSSMLYVHGARSMTWHLTHGEKTAMHYSVRFLCSDDDKREVIEAFLIKGEASEVLVSLVEQHCLNRRLVSVPLGHGNKTFSARLHEYIYYDKTVRVEPLAEDLDAYVLKTGYSVDVARSDLLLAWKKWRGRVASET